MKIGDLKAMVEGTDNRIKSRPVVRIGLRRRCQGKTTALLPGLTGKVIQRGSRRELSVVEISGEDVKAYLDLVEFKPQARKEERVRLCG